jgi:sterol desaturase/sphingolipid hydroxylase (fatty acid hydroxylase superfamily)
MLDVTDDLPPFYWMFIQFWGMNVLHTTMFYWIHRTLHIPFLYRTIHKQHHEFKETAVPVSEYFHPIEDFFNVIIAAASPAIILGNTLHPVVYLTFLVVLTWDGGGALIRNSDNWS